MQMNRRVFMKGAGYLAGVAATSGGIVTSSIAAPERKVATTKSYATESARRYAPNASYNDFASFFPEHKGIRTSEELMSLAGKEMDEWMTKTSKSESMQQRANKCMPFGVFGTYMRDWETPHLLYSKLSSGNRVWDVDDNEYIDFNFGDTPSMFGHASANPAIRACAERMLNDGLNTMMGNEDSIIAAELLAEKFGQPFWMHALTASDANRYVLAIARHHTSRRIVAIPNFTYHGTVDETQKFSPGPGRIARYNSLNQYAMDPDYGTRIFQWNDLESLEEILSDGQVAIVMMEPVMSNFGWAWPKPDWHKGVNELCKKYGTLLCYDETHTISQGPEGMVGHLGIKGMGDFWTCGKCISSGIPGAVYGMSEAVAKKLHDDQHAEGFFVGAGLGYLGNALCGNTMSSLALRVTLDEVLTEEVFKEINTNADYLATGMRNTIKKYNAPFRIEVMGNRLCYHFIPEEALDPLTGAVSVGFGGLFEYSHAYAWNNGILIMPYFNMMLIAPGHTQEDSDKWLTAWDHIVKTVTVG